jgi:transposase
VKTRKPAAPGFKPYVMNQVSLLPPSYAEMIPKNHMVRVVNDAVDKIDVSALLAQYKWGVGHRATHPVLIATLDIETQVVIVGMDLLIRENEPIR